MSTGLLNNVFPKSSFPLDVPERTYSPLVRKEQFITGAKNLNGNKIPFMTKREIQAEYSFEVVIGEGAEGIVMAGYQKRKKVKIAAKLITLSEHNKLSFALLETKIQASINHAAVPLVVDLFMDEDYIYIIQEFVEGEPIFELLCDFKFDETECKIIIYQLLDLLDYLHNSGVVHGDIKAENIIYDQKTKKIYLLDFGSAHTVKNPEKCFTKGSIGYFSPEIIAENDTIPVESDIWAVGVLLYIMITGRPPFISDPDYRDDINYQNAPFWIFYNDDTDNLRFEIQSGKFDLEGIPKHLADLLRKMLHVKRSKRITAKMALTHSWFNGVENNRVLRNPICAKKFM